MRTTCRHSRGFTLIEIAVVLFIVGLLFVGAMSAVITFTKSAREKITRQNQDAIKVALQNFVARTGRLPCPAVPSDAPAAATFGLESPTPWTGTCTGAIDLGTGSPTPGVFGTLPWKSLGVPAENAIDGWNNQFSYAVTRTATNTRMTTVGGMRGVLTLHSDAPVVNGLPGPSNLTGNQLNACSQTAGDNSCNLFSAVIVISHGPNGIGARTWFGVTVPGTGSNRETENTDTDVAFVDSGASDVAATYFDDKVMALAPADVLASLIQQGGVKSDYAALAQDYQQLTAILAAYAVANRSGAPASWQYPLPSAISATGYTLDATRFDINCDSNPPADIGLPTAAMQLVNDPWGNTFRYQRAMNSIRASTTCPTYAVFVSAGPDGNIATTADNSIFYLSKGEFDAIVGLSGW